MNIGAVLGKAFAKPLRTGFRLPYVAEFKLGLEYINYYAAIMAVGALLLVLFVYRDAETRKRHKTVPEILSDLRLVKCPAPQSADLGPASYCGHVPAAIRPA